MKEEEFNREQILDAYGRESLHKDIKFIIKTDQKVVAVLDYRDILLKRKIKENLLCTSKNVWRDARKYFNAIENLYSGACIGVVDETGGLQYVLEYRYNNYFIDEEYDIHFYSFEQYEELSCEIETIEENGPYCKTIIKKIKGCRLFF